jgi:hydroxymethylbilane synthase
LTAAKCTCALVATPDGTRVARAEVNGAAADAEALGAQVAEQLRAQDAEAILAVCAAEQADAMNPNAAPAA